MRDDLNLEEFTVTEVHSPEKPKREFTGIWIPRSVWLSDLPIQEKVMMVEISQLDGKHGCYASNKYFSRLFNITPGRISQIISSLHKKKYISIELHKKGKVVINRVVRILNQPIENIKHPYLEYSQERVYIKKEKDYVESAKAPSNAKDIHGKKKIPDWCNRAAEYSIKQIKKTHPHLTLNGTTTAKAADMFDKFVRLDGKNPQNIKKVLDWLPKAPTDNRTGFSWGQQIQSPLKLRKRDKDGVMYFDKLISAMREEPRKLYA